MNSKVMYHIGEDIDLKTKVLVGRLVLEPDRLTIRGEKAADVLFSALRSVELFRLHGTGRMLKIVHNEGTLYVTVIRFCLCRGRPICWNMP